MPAPVLPVAGGFSQKQVELDEDITMARLELYVPSTASMVRSALQTGCLESPLPDGLFSQRTTAFKKKCRS